MQTIHKPAALANEELRRLEKEQRGLQRSAFFRSPLSLVGLTVIVLLVLIAVFAPVLAGGRDPLAQDLTLRLKAPSAEHPFGTDDLGRDVFARVLYGARVSLVVGFAVSAIAGAAGLLIGLYSCRSKLLDAVLMRVCDGLSAIPSTLFAICLMAFLGPSIRNVILSMTIVCIPTIARTVRSAALSAREQTYVEAMRCLGAPPRRILWRHIMPATLPALIVQMTFAFALSIITEATLSFLGAGVPSDVPSWGSILSQGRAYIYTAWWLILYPGLFTAVSVLGLNLFGDGLRDLLDPLSH